jgi:hypothetical protein
MAKIVGLRLPGVTFDRSWRYRLQRRFADVFVVVKCHSQEEARGCVPSASIYEHFIAVQTEMRTTTTPSLWVNVDETGFAKRTKKDTC